MNNEIEQVRHETALHTEDANGELTHVGTNVEFIDAWQWVYGYNNLTREYTGPQKAYLDPGALTAEQKVLYINPPNTCADAPNGPIPPPKYRTYRRTLALDAWELVPDYRNVIVYEKATGQAAIIVDIQLGAELPENVTTMAPTYFRPEEFALSRWDSHIGAWETIPDYSHIYVYDTTTALPLPRLEAGQLLPKGATVLRPLLPGEHESPVWDKATQAWKLMADWRGTSYWVDGQEHRITELGDVPPAAASFAPPPPPPTPSQQLGQLLADAALTMAPLSDAVELGIATDAEKDRLNAWKAYRVALSRTDLTASAVSWPTKPE